MAALKRHPHHEMLLACGTQLSVAGYQGMADTLFLSLRNSCLFHRCWC